MALSFESKIRKVNSSQPSFLDKARPVSQPTQPLSDSIWGSLAKGAGNIAIGAAKSLGSSVIGLGQTTQTISKALVPESLERPLFGEDIPTPQILEPQGTAQKIGAGLEQVGEFVAGGALVKAPKLAVQGAIGATKLAPAIRSGIKILAGAGLEGLGAGLVKTIQESGDFKEGAKTAGIATAISTPFEALRILSAPASALLKTGAEKRATQALAPTTKENKQLAERIVPEMLKRRVRFFSREGLVGKAEDELSIAGQQLEDAYSVLPPNTKVAIAPIIDKLEKAKTSLIPQGTNVVPRAVQPEYQALSNIQQEMIDVANGKSQVAIESLRSYRQILDKFLKKAGAGFGFTGKEKASQLATKSMANSIRAELAKEFPDIAKINAEYNFWSNVKQVVGATIERTKGQGEPLGRQIMEGAGFAGGLATGGIGNAVSGLLSMHFLKNAVSSPVWRNTSGILRQQIADALASGNNSAVLDILGRLAIGTEESIRSGQE